MEDITDADYIHAKGVCMDVEIKQKISVNIMICILKVIHYFCLMFSKTSKKICLKTCHSDPAKCLSAPGLARKQLEVKFELLTHIDMLLMVEKGIRGRICYVIYQFATANNKYMNG